VLWVIGVFIAGDVPGEGASEAEYLAYIEADASTILLSGWIFMLGCVAFLWFAIVLRVHLAAAEGGTRMFSNVAFVGALATGAFMMLTPGPEIAAAITVEEKEISASTAAAMSILGEAFISAATLTAILLMLGSGIVALGTRIFPKAWAWFSSFLLAIVLVIGPIGWAALLFGLPVWIIGTTVFLSRRGALPLKEAA
jgi:hypothetical protein